MAVNLGDSDSENPKRKRKRRKLRVNEKVEVRSEEDGLLGSWHSGTVIAYGNHSRYVRYDNILCDDGSKYLVDLVYVSPAIDGIVASDGTQCSYRGHIRPLPPRLDSGKRCLHYGLCVDAFFKDSWWEGVIFDHEDGSEERKIFFPDIGDEMKIGIDLLRLTQDWEEVTENWKGRGNWFFLELIEEYEQERPLTVSVKQIWYDLREKKDFGKVGEWTNFKETIWKELVLEVINDNLMLTVNEISQEMDIPGNSVLEAQPVSELPEPVLDVALEREANSANTHTIVPSESNCLLENDMAIDSGKNVKILMDCSINVAVEWAENGCSATGLRQTNLNSTSVQPIEQKLDLGGVISAMEVDGSGMNFVTNSNVSSHDKALSVQHQALLVTPSNLDGISSISSNTNSEGFTSTSSIKVSGKPTCSTHKQNRKWLPAGPDILPGAEFCPGAITQYALATSAEKKPRNSLLKNARQHLSYLGWKIEFMRDKGIVRMRYTSPQGQAYLSLREVCRDLTELTETLSPTSIGDQRSLPTSPDDLSSYQLVEQSQVSEEATEVPYPNDVIVEPEYCPQAVIDWYKLGYGKKVCSKRDMIIKAKKHLSAVGWVFWHTRKRVKPEIRYKSPTGRSYSSLRKACKSIIDEGGVSESNYSAFRPLKSIDVREEAEVHLACDKSSSALIGTEFKGSLVPQSLPSEKRLILYHGISQSTELVDLSKVKVRGIRKRRKKMESGFLHLAFPSLQNQTQADLHAGQDRFAVRLIGNRNRRHLKDQNASFPKSKKRKVSRALIKLGVDGSCPPRVLRSSKRARQVEASSSSHHNPRTVLSWLIDNNVVLPRAKVYYRARKDRHPMAEGRITRDGIKCSCCQKVFTLSGFQNHAGSTYHRPAANIFLVDGTSLLECQMQIIGETNMRGFATEPRYRLKGHRHHCDNDYICSVCHYGGELILCDQCPSSFHKSCLGLKEVPEGDWFCPSCCCGICDQNKFNETTGHHMDSGVLHCDQCEHQYHVGCLRKMGLVKLESYPKGNWFCSKKCEKIFLGLQKLIGKPVAVGVDNLTWTLLKSTKYNSRDIKAFDIEALTENCSKLNVALGVMHECFEPVKEHNTRRDLVEDVIFSRGSDLNRLNFRGFYTVLLERNEELITVATVRVYGEKVAEVPLVGTRFQYRRLGMCRILMNELEKKLMALGVERLILPAVPSVLHTWTTAFGFSKMTDSERLEFLDYTFLDFQDTTMCQKLLKKIRSAEASLLRGTPHKFCDDINGSGDNIDFDGFSAVSEVFQAEQIGETEIVNQESVDISVGNGSTITASLVDMATQLTHLERKSCCGEMCLECSDEDAIHKKEGGANANGLFKYYSRRRPSVGGS